jgi:drug/metabolite transporter (DMT)-like permease
MAVLQAFILFGERVTSLGILGIAMTALGVALVIRS